MEAKTLNNLGFLPVRKTLLLCACALLATLSWLPGAHARAMPRRGRACSLHVHGYKHVNASLVPQWALDAMLKEVELSEGENLVMGNARARYDDVTTTITYNAPNDIQTAQCSNSLPAQRDAVTPTDGVTLRALCPWAPDTPDYDAARFPAALPRVKCVCRNCIGMTRAERGCEPVFSHRFVLQVGAEVGTGAGRIRCWERRVVKVPVACMCAQHQRSRG